MKKIFFLFLPLLSISNIYASPICPIMKTVIRASSIDGKKAVKLCDMDSHFVLTFGSKNSPEIILYKKSNEVTLPVPRRGTEVIILDGAKRYVIRDDEVKAYIVEMDDAKSIIVFTELDKENANYINRSYILLNRKE